MRNNKRYFYEVPAHVSYAEAAALYRFMATGETEKTEFLKKENQIIFDTLQTLLQPDGRGITRSCIGTRELIEYLDSTHTLDAAGGLAYINKIFGSLEPVLGAVC